MLVIITHPLTQQYGQVEAVWIYLVWTTVYIYNIFQRYVNFLSSLIVEPERTLIIWPF